MRIDDIYAVNLKPQRRGGDEMVRRLKTFECQVRRRELEQFIYGQAQEPLVSESKRGSRVARPALLNSLVDDLGRYIDLCLARFLVWRETRRKRKA